VIIVSYQWCSSFVLILVTISLCSKNTCILHAWSSTERTKTLFLTYHVICHFLSKWSAIVWHASSQIVSLLYVFLSSAFLRWWVRCCIICVWWFMFIKIVRSFPNDVFVETYRWVEVLWVFVLIQSKDQHLFSSSLDYKKYIRVCIDVVVWVCWGTL